MGTAGHMDGNHDLDAGLLLQRLPKPVGRYAKRRSIDVHELNFSASVADAICRSGEGNGGSCAEGDGTNTCGKTGNVKRSRSITHRNGIPSAGILSECHLEPVYSGPLS